MTGILLSNKRLSDKNREMLRIIHESSLSAHDMVSDLIDAMLNNRKESLRISSFSIKELVERCIHLQAARALEKQQQIVLKAQEVKLMQGDPQKIERLMSNLLHNAIKFSPKGAPIEVELKTVKASVKISVKDRGIGIPETIQPHIFDTYSAGMRYGTAGEAPIGIGLSICRQITEAHQGCIGFKSKPEKGSTFYVELPYKYSSAAGKDA
jgi:signal transduction histidine kinase